LLLEDLDGLVGALPLCRTELEKALKDIGANTGGGAIGIANLLTLVAKPVIELLKVKMVSIDASNT
jgi:hypothetical protein